MKRVLLFALALLTGLLGLGGAQSLPKELRDRIIKSTVMLLPTGKDGKLDGSLGSGSVISPLGYILTNYHVVGDPDERTLSKWVQVRVVRAPDQEPEFAYWAQVVAADADLDLAVVKIVQDTKEKPVSGLNLPFVELGDSNSLTIGDSIFVFGFQGTGGMTLSYSRGSVAGFTGEDLESSGKRWVKHDAQTGPGNSGGGVFDEAGALVGVHSAGVAGEHNSRTSFMRPLGLAWNLIRPTVPRFALHDPNTVTTSPASAGQSTPVAGTAGTPSGSAAANPGVGNASTGSSGAWPPRLAVGQNWTVAFKGQNLADTWAVALTGLDSDGDPKGSATSGSRKLTAFMYYDAKNDRVWVDLTSDGKTTTSCAFDRAGVKTPTWAGRAYRFKDGDDDGERIGDCTALLKSGQAALPAAASPSTPPAPAPAQSALKWPVKPQVGQTWSFTIQGRGTWTVKLNGLSKKGNPTGPATSSKGEKWVGFFYYVADERVLWLDLTEDGESYVFCRFTSGSVQGGALSGEAQYSENNDSDPKDLGRCTATLK